jgi:hypothetical protein
VKTASGATAVQIVYSSHRGSRDIKHIGSAGDDAELEEEVKILHKAAAAVGGGGAPKSRYRLVAELHAEGVRTGRACHALAVSRSGYYA